MSATPSFHDVQATLADRVNACVPSSGTIVVLPSISFPPSELAKITAIERYEERLLYLVLLLARDDVRLVYVSSLPIDPAIVEYYLSFLPDPDAARTRLQLVSVGEYSPRGLAHGLLAHPDAIERVRDAVGADADRAYLLPFHVTDAECQFALRVGLPLFAVHPDLVPLGSKTGSRLAARAVGVPVLPGLEDLWSIDDLAAGIETLRKSDPACMNAVVVKLNNGFSGQGNAMIDLTATTESLTARKTTFCGTGETWPSFAAKIAAEGAVVEQLVSTRLASPSVQAWIGPDRRFEIVSTHDQILGGPGGQVYLGCRFPADARYRAEIVGYTKAMAKHLASAGVVGPFAIDFSVADGSRTGIFLSEINLRLGGTTHPFGIARLATGAQADPLEGMVVGEEPRAYIASDNLKSERLIGTSPQQLIDWIHNWGLAFDPDRKLGVTLHLLGAVPEYGKFGAVCIARSLPEAEELGAEIGRLLGISMSDAGHTARSVTAS